MSYTFVKIKQQDLGELRIVIDWHFDNPETLDEERRVFIHVKDLANMLGLYPSDILELVSRNDKFIHHNFDTEDDVYINIYVAVAITYSTSAPYYTACQFRRWLLDDITHKVYKVSYSDVYNEITDLTKFLNS